MKCFYHKVDLDGWMSARIVKERFPECELIPFNYGEKIPETEEGESLVFVDVSIPPKDLHNLSLKHEVTWIDHHISAINNWRYSEYSDKSLVNIFINCTFAACELTWDYYFPDSILPKAIHLLGMYDSFRHKGTLEEMDVLYFQYYARSVANSPDTIPSWWLDDYSMAHYQILEQALNKGVSIYEYLCKDAENTFKSHFLVTILNQGRQIKFACINTERFNPINYGIDYHKFGYDGFISFHYADGMWSFSVYNDNGDVDCSEIAKIYGGGGHKGAAGFKLKDLNLFVMGL